MLVTQRQKATVISQAPHNLKVVNVNVVKPPGDEMKKATETEFPRLKNESKGAKLAGHIQVSFHNNSDEEEAEDNTKIITLGKSTSNGLIHAGTGGGHSSISSNASGGPHQQQHFPVVTTNNGHQSQSLNHKPSVESMDTNGTADASKGGQTKTSQSFAPVTVSNYDIRTSHGNIRRSSTWEGFLDHMIVDQVFQANRPYAVAQPSGTSRRVIAGTGTLTRNNTTILSGSTSNNVTPATTPRSQVHFQIGVARRPPVMRPLKEGVVDGDGDDQIEQPLIAASQNTELFQRVKAWLEDLPQDLERPITPVIIEDEPRPLEATFTFIHNDR